MPNRSRTAAGSRMEPDSNAPPPQLTDEQWLLIQDLFPVPAPAPDPRGGRPRADLRHDNVLKVAQIATGSPRLVGI